MKGFKETGFADRLSTAAKAKQAQLEKARTKAPANDPAFAQRQAERRAAAAAREIRIAERKKEKLLQAEREAAERATAEVARAVALEAEKRAAELAKKEEAARKIALEAEQKAARDARYAARKQRKR